MGVNRLKITSSICAAFVMILGFQNCGPTMGDAPAAQPNEPVTNRLSKTIHQLSIPLSSASWSERVEIKPDGSVVNLQTAQPYSIEPQLSSEIAELMSVAELCFYQAAVLVPGHAVCMAMPAPHAFATTDTGEEIPLAVSICNNDTTDLCQSSRDTFHNLVQRIQTAIAAP
jgi:hypothetical protein